jgi:hypothetical protein
MQALVSTIPYCRRAAHFANFKEDGEDEEGQDNVHIGGQQVRRSKISVPKGLCIALSTSCAANCDDTHSWPPGSHLGTLEQRC